MPESGAATEEACPDLGLRKVAANCRAEGIDRGTEEACATAAARGTRDLEVAAFDIWCRFWGGAVCVVRLVGLGGSC